jgi:hypothetical protein
MRRFLPLILLLLLTITLASCSYITDFVILNDTDSRIEVVYRIKPSPPGPPSLEVIEPMVVSAANLEAKGVGKWTKLEPHRFRIDQLNRTVTVVVSAHEGLRIASMHHYLGNDGPNDVQNFPIQDLSVTGKHGEMKFTGDATRRAFEKRSLALYVLSYK